MDEPLGNLEMRINSSSPQPSTYFLPIATFVGRGKSIHYRFLTKLMNLLKEGISELDQQIFEAQNGINKAAEEEDEEKKDVKKEKPKLLPRQLLHGPGSKEG